MESPAFYHHVVVKDPVWKTKASQKLKHFLWRLLTRSLARGSNLKRRHIVRDAQCRRCCSAKETEDHIFFECPYAKRIWRASGISNMIINSSTASLKENIAECLRSFLSRRFLHFQDHPVWILWRLWKSRNTFIFQSKETHWGSLIRYTKNDAMEWKQNEYIGQNRRTPQAWQNRSTEAHRWKRPQHGWFKCNTDGSFINTHIHSSAGWIIRDSDGTYKGSVQARGRRTHNALEIELQAILMALQHCWF